MKDLFDEFNIESKPQNTTGIDLFDEFGINTQENKTIDNQQYDFSKAKPNNIFSTDGLNTNAPQRADSWWKSAWDSYKKYSEEYWAREEKMEKEINDAGKEFFKEAASYGEVTGKSSASGMVDLIGIGGGSFIGAIGDQLVDKKEYIAKSIKHINPLAYMQLKAMNMIVNDEQADIAGIDKAIQKRINTFGQTLQKGSDVLYKISDLAKEDLKLDDKIFEGEIWENPSAKRFLALYGSVVPSMVSMAGLSKLTGSKAFTYITMGGLSSGDIYREAKEKGIDLDKRTGLYAASWASQSILERLFDPIANVFDAKVLGNSIPKQIAKRVFSGMMESGTEFSQTLSQNAIKKYGGIDETQDLMEGVIESMIGGFFGGTVFSGAFNERNQALLDKGMSQDEINAVIDEAGRYVSGHADELNDFAYQKITEGLSTFEEFIKTHAGTPEAQKAIQTKKDLEFVGEQVYDMLKKAGRTEESAKKESQIIQGISLWGAEETGLSPVEFIKQRFPEVKQMKLKDFQEQFAQKKQRADLKNVNLFEAVLNPKIRKEIEQAEKAERGLSLIQFIKQRGGLKDVDGDLKAMDAGKMQIGLINNKGGNDLDDIALAAWENGYFPDKMERPDIDELKSAIRDELFGEKKYAYQQGKESVLKDIEELEAALDMLDIDYSNMSASELEAVYNEAVNEYNASNKVTFDEDEYIDDEDYIPFQESMDIAKENEELDKANPKYEGETINIDGVEKTVYNSNGDRIAMSEPALRNFYKWFGDSKVVDEQGRPLVVYHGTPNKFDTFDVERVGTQGTAEGNGFYFTTSKKFAQGYAKETWVEGERVPGNVMPVYLKIENPLEFGLVNGLRGISESKIREVGKIISDKYIKYDETRKTFNDVIDFAIQNGKEIDITEAIAILQNNAEIIGDEINDTPGYEVAQDVRNIISKEIGIDGFFRKVKGHTVYIAFSPNQIKSVDNRGTFSKDSDNIYFQQDEGENVVDLSDAFDKNPSIEDVKSFLNKVVVEGATYATLSPDWIVDIKSNRRSKQHIAYSDKWKTMTRQEKGRHNKYVISFEKIIKNAEYSHSRKNNKTDKKPNVLKYHYFTSQVRIGDKIYNVVLDAEQFVGENENKPQTVHLYNIKEVPASNSKTTIKKQGTSNAIISQPDGGVKSYQNTNDPRGAYYKDIIYLFEKANASTFMHETAHWFKEELKKFGSEKSAMMLKKVDEWENEEFVKRYTVALENGRYVVKNKVGSIVYDQAFQTAEDAKDYAKNELFARGFEAYLKEGKAPNSYLKNAFKSFWNWLRQLYRSAKTLNVELNDNIRGVYGNILGGMDLDFYLNAPTVQAIAQRQQREKDRASFIEQEIERAQELEKRKKRIPFANFRQERKESKKDGVKWWDQVAIPISTRAKRISPKLRNKLRGYDFNVLQEQKRQYELITPFYKKWQGMNENDIIAFDLALKNGHGDLQNRIVKKYGAEAEFKAVRDLLEEIYANAETVGIDMGYQGDYFPREIADLDGLMEYLYSTEMVSELRRAQKEAGFRDMTDEERADFINKFLRGYQNKDLITPPPGNVKDRRIDVITAEINEFYKPSSQALFSYIDRMTNTIESRKFFGKDMEHVEESIGAFVDELIDNGEIKPTQDKEVEHILRARFKQKGVSNKFLIYQRNMSYIYTMGGINSAITQLADLSVAMYKGGVWNTAKAIFGEKAPELTREGLGLEKIGQEFVDASTSSKVVEKIFKLTGLDKIDAFGKNILTQSVYIKFKDMAKNSPEKLKELIEPIMEQKTSEVVNDLAEGKITPNVQFLVYNELADVQPITLSEMPEGYLAGGNWRIMYMLKTFMVKRIDTFRNECFDKIRSGQPEEVKKGLKNLFSLAMLIMLCGAAKDTLIDLLYGRKIVLKEMVQNNVLGLIGITKYQLYKAREDGWGGFASSFIPPVFGIWSDLGRDMSDDFLTAKGKDLKDYEVLKGIPLVGRFYYWWFGGGRTKEEKKKKKKLK